MQPWLAMMASDRLIVETIAFACGVALLLNTGAALGDPLSQLERMGQALRTREYEGTLVHLRDHQLSALRIAHRIENGESRASLLTLNGPLRTLARSERGIACLLPGQQRPILVDRAPAANLRRSATGADWSALERHYQIQAKGSSRVAGREVELISIQPRDEFRYGYRVSIDDETALPLQIELLNQDAEPLEQLMFTELQVQPLVTTPIAAPSATTPVAAEPPTATTWTVTTLPPGFRHHRYQRTAQGIEHFLFGDGLASVSVYIEPVQEFGLQGATRLGAIHAAGRQIDAHQVTVVGEVPAVTVMHLLNGVQHND